MMTPRPTMISNDEEQLSHEQLESEVLVVRRALAEACGELSGTAVVLLASPGPGWLIGYRAIVDSGAMCVPLSGSYPVGELPFFANLAGAQTVLFSRDMAERGSMLFAERRCLEISELRASRKTRPAVSPNLFPANTPALMLFTSGTTGRPKGAVLTQGNLIAQTSELAETWGITSHDRLLHMLPLHHLHGILVALLTVAAKRGSIHFAPFSAERLLKEFLSGRHSVFMAVPTMYAKLRDYVASQPSVIAELSTAVRGNLRLATSGSAALPKSLASWWETIHQAIPLERYGMTEIGIAASNPLDPAARKIGTVGLSLPSVQIRLVNEENQTDDAENTVGELWVRGPSVFAGYAKNSVATADAFFEDWFKTGDIVERDEDGYLRVLGRSSADIIKSGGYKLSALEIEEILREHPAVADAAVWGISDETWGEIVTAAIILNEKSSDADPSGEIAEWLKTRLPKYKIPKGWRIVSEFPRNAMGKVQKNLLKENL